MEDKPEVVKIKVPSGKFEVAVRAELNYEQYEEIQSILMTGVTVDASTQKSSPIPADVTFKANRKAAEYAIVSVVNLKTTETVEDPYNAVRKMSIADGQAVMDAVAASWQRNALSKKNSKN